MQKTLKRQPGLCSVSLFLLFLLTACTGSEKMRRDLDALQEKNLADSLLTDSTLAMTLADYFDSHGSQAERLEAHYLLARTWADLGQAPRALDAFHTAAEQADTTRLDSRSCHWLSRIYGQMAELLYNYQLPYNAIASYRKAESYALMCKEQIAAAIIHEHQASCYYLMGEHERAVQTLEQTHYRLKNLGDTLSANNCLGPLSFYALQHEDLKKAKQFIALYELGSSSWNKDNPYYQEQLMALSYHKGNYYLGCGKNGSAFIYFTQFVRQAKTSDLQALAFNALYRLYQQSSNPDSACKYAILYAQYKDSTFQNSVSAALLSMHNLYDYNRLRTESDQQTIKTERANIRWTILVSLLILVVLSSLYCYFRIRTKNRLQLQRMNAKYVLDITTYARIKAELQSTIELEYSKRKLLEKELQELKKEICHAHADNALSLKMDDINELLSMPIVTKFHHSASQCKPMSTTDWTELRQACHALMPSFLATLEKKGQKLDLKETQICILTRMHFTLSEISALLQLSSTSLSHKRIRMNKKLFDMEGTAKQFDFNILNM